MKTTKQKLIAVGALLSLCCGISTGLQAAPLPDGAVLGIDQGVGSSTNNPCVTGSCFGVEVAPGLEVWTSVGPGTDEGLIIGKNQASGGQELAPSSANTTPGEVTDAFNYYANYGTLYSPLGSTNIFDDQPCAGASCIGKTELKSWNLAWNGQSIPFGSANGCLSLSCSADQLAGIFVTEWTIGSPTGSAYTLKYGSVVPDQHPSGFGNVPYKLILRGYEAPFAQFAPGTLLTIDRGVGSAPNMPCTAGSCFGKEVAPGSLVVWTDFGPGTDGGIVVGKNQVSGGQELAPSSTNATSGEMTNAYYFFSNYGTWHTPAGSTNTFSKTSCTGADCLGKTVLRSLNEAWNNTDIPFGDTCRSPSCSADQLAGILVDQWIVNLDGSYELHYSNVVPDGDGSGTGNVRTLLILRGQIIPDGTPPVYMASFTASKVIPELDEVIQFTDTTEPTQIKAVAWSWDFGDGATSSLQNPTHRYSATGFYTAALTVTDDFGNLYPSTLELQVIQKSPYFLSISGLHSEASNIFIHSVSADGSTIGGTADVLNPDTGASEYHIYRWSRTQGLENILRTYTGSSRYYQRIYFSEDGLTAAVSNDDIAYRWTPSTGLVDIGALGMGSIFGPRAYAFNISDDASTIVGYSEANGWEPFRWTERDGISTLGTKIPGVNNNSAYDASADGSIIVGNNGHEAFRWTEETGMVSLIGAPTEPAIATAISADGSTITGTFDDAAVGQKGWIWDQAQGIQFIDTSEIIGSSMSAISADGGVMVGRGRVINTFGAVLWMPGHGTRDLNTVLALDYGFDVSGWILTSAADVSADGKTIVGTGTNPSGVLDGWMVKLPTLPPYTEDQSIMATKDTLLTWTPFVTDPENDTLTCEIIRQPANGVATIASDCSSGTYKPDFGFLGTDTGFTYRANDGIVNSNVATVTPIVPTPPPLISGLWPTDGPPGTFVFVFGENFVEGDSFVQVNGVVSPIVQVLDQDILIFLLPEGNTNGPVRVTTSEGSVASSISFGVPTTGLNISGLWPAVGGPGDIVFLFGTEFVVGSTTVALNSTSVQIAQALDESILIMMLPSGISTGPFTVTTPTATATSGEIFTVR